MLRRGYLRSKSKRPDPIGNLYGKAVRHERKALGLKVHEWEPHHPAGRLGKNKLFFAMITPSLHRQIHQHPAWARENGWLARPNGSFDIDQAAVIFGRQRQQDLIAQLENA